MFYLGSSLMIFMCNVLGLFYFTFWKHNTMWYLYQSIVCWQFIRASAVRFNFLSNQFRTNWRVSMIEINCFSISSFSSVFSDVLKCHGRCLICDDGKHSLHLCVSIYIVFCYPPYQVVSTAWIPLTLSLSHCLSLSLPLSFPLSLSSSPSLPIFLSLPLSLLLCLFLSLSL